MGDHILIKLTPELRDAIKAYCDRHGITQAEFVRQTIAEKLRKPKLAKGVSGPGRPQKLVVQLTRHEAELLHMLIADPYDPAKDKNEKREKLILSIDVGQYDNSAYAVSWLKELGDRDEDRAAQRVAVAVAKKLGIEIRATR